MCRLNDHFEQEIWRFGLATYRSGQPHMGLQPLPHRFSEHRVGAARWWRRSDFVHEWTCPPAEATIKSVEEVERTDMLEMHRNGNTISQPPHACKRAHNTLTHTHTHTQIHTHTHTHDCSPSAYARPQYGAGASGSAMDAAWKLRRASGWLYPYACQH